MSRTIRSFVALAGLLIAASCSSADTDNSAPTSPFAALPGLEADQPGTLDRTFVTATRNTGELAGAIATTDTGDIVAYFCDGERGYWLTGSPTDNTDTIELSSDDATLTFDTDALEHSTFEAELVLNGDTSLFSMVTATDGAGLYRFTEESLTGGDEVTAGWIVMNDGQLVGATNTGAGVTGEPGRTTTEEAVTAGLIRKFRCARIVLRFSQWSTDNLAGTLTDQNINLDVELSQQFTDLNCFGEGFVLT
jgi:hypothetical protein